MELKLLAQQVQLQKDTMRDVLRQQTQDVHEQLHHHDHFVALFDGTSSLRQYRDLLERFHGFYAPLEEAIGLYIAAQPDWDGEFTYPKRAQYLEQDLLFLDCAPMDVQQSPHCQALFDCSSPASLGGILYVIEGSTLGATHIDRAAQKLLKSDTTQGRSFWAWSRANNKQRWAMTLRYLDHLDETGVPKDAVVKSANETFQALADWLAPMSLEGTQS